MFTTDNSGNITIPRGDSATIAFELTDAETGEPYILHDGQYAVFSVHMYAGAAAVIAQTLVEQTESGAVTVTLSPEETNITRGEYIYTLRLYNANQTEIDTVQGGVNAAIFEVV